ncbi:MAG TPA: DUF2520 domain-containing protein [Bacteroidales bacterium]|nr:DUF2520 domain-containing protein [Bacteroidales bacterium]HBZ20726.1 DUF2520 domain-containing protein [Bacteroidales bacterium]
MARPPRPEEEYINCSVKQYRISFIGAGKVSGALCRQMHQSGFRIQKIISRTRESGRALARSCDAIWSSAYEFSDSEDVIIVAVPDDKLPEILSQIKSPGSTVIAHTAGSLGLDIFPASLRHTGVFYPLQTFSENRNISFDELPLFLEASDDYSSAILKAIAESIGCKVFFTDTGHRRLLHIAAVFACNFTNQMLTAGKQIAMEAGFNFEVLRPLIDETIIKALEEGPDHSQTGPAIRSDIGTIKRHIDLLSFSPELQGIYKEVTKSIMKFYKTASDDQF